MDEAIWRDPIPNFASRVAVFGFGIARTTAPTRNGASRGEVETVAARIKETESDKRGRRDAGSMSNDTSPSMPSEKQGVSSEANADAEPLVVLRHGLVDAELVRRVDIVGAVDFEPSEIAIVIGLDAET